MATVRKPLVLISGDFAELPPADALGHTGIGARVYNSANQSIANAGVGDVITFNTEVFDNDAIHDNVTNNSRLTCKTAGLYVIYATVIFASNPTGVRAVDIRLNGTSNIGENQVAAGSNVLTVSVGTLYPLIVGDYIEVVAYQSSGGALNSLASGQTGPALMMGRLGS